MERNLLFTLRFVGTAYHGFQVQQNAITICQVFQDALAKVTGQRGMVKGCSRTDAGVHANRYAVSLKTNCPIPCERMVYALNQALPEDLAVMRCQEVDPAFHARYSAKGKRYVYKVHNSRIRDPFLKGRVHSFFFPIDAQALQKEAEGFVGTHDFRGFCAKGSDIEDTVRTIHRFQVERQGELVLFTVEGDGFLYNMVRIMVGTLLGIAGGQIPQGAIPTILAQKDRKLAGKTAPAEGLYLDDIFYEDLTL